ncbi:ABC transporter ATP-binding protein [Pseudoxanthomonas composti]|uniref:sn-glycerol-3-phosphate ABC transporter ATP-binding protein UgpC n=1 Tax=Pseudoxanthomonas composti TaxID=2137479 RepID=A0A4V1N1D1_9GAMM|nr:sn-glycerol-3-phosphate ABC transporter ATP-binding protein UgpC [Pseudoxanthomonas composti]RXR07229.1 sn-glycerol-3-phosphate ABC transporter ATP-binding protein UgpC [Pseudoxanthomonas composti]
MASVQLDGVRKVYDNGQVAVHGASFEIADGELMVLVGPSGCGKSTLLRMIAGLEEISGGTLKIGERVVNDVAPKDRDIAMVFQSYALYPHMTVAENLAFGLKLRKHDKATIDARIKAAAETLGLTAMLDKLPKAMSGGQRQRVALGRALVREPSVFLLDEPLSNLDAKLRHSVRTEIARLHRQLGTTMIYVTHDQVEAMTLGQRIVVLKDGQIQQIDTPMALYDRPANLFVAGFLGSPAMNVLRGIAQPEGLLLERGALLPWAGPPSLPAGVLGQPLVVGVRPEDLHLAQADEPGAFQATLDNVEPVGNEIFLHLQAHGLDLIARIPPRSLPAPGAAVWLRLDSARLHYFDPATEARIEPAIVPGPATA